MTCVGVIAHAGKRLGGGLPELRKALAESGRWRIRTAAVVRQAATHEPPPAAALDAAAVAS